MHKTERLQWLSMISLLLVAAGCGDMPSPFKVKDRSPRADVDAPFDPPNTYPEWAYDAHKYTRAVDELTPEPKVNANDPLHYFTNQKLVLIRQPDGYTPEEIPRVAIWWTDNNGFHWNKAGYFGRTQTFFPFETEEDGDYGIRFVGPGQEPALQSLPYPERVYHVDTVLPAVEVMIDPEKTWYNVGESVTVSWRASDYHLIENPVRVGVLYDFTKRGDNAIELQRDLSDEGSLAYTIPQDALDHEIRFRVDALDRAGNLGIAISYALQVVPFEKQEVNELTGHGGIAQSYPESPEPPARHSSLPAPQPVRVSPMPEAPGTTASVYTNPSMARTPTPAPAPATPPDPVQPAPVTVGSSTPQPPPAQPQRTTTTLEPGMHWGTTVPGGTSSSSSSHGGTVGTNTPADVSTMTPIDMPVTNRSTPPAQRPIPVTHQQTPAPPAAPAQSPSRPADESSESTDKMVPMKESNASPSSPDATSSLEPESFIRSSPKLAPASSGAGSPPVGVTRSDGLLVSLPATVQASPAQPNVIAHPWRTLQSVIPLALDTVWKLPRPNFDSAELNRMLDDSRLAGGKAAEPVSEPGRIGTTVVSVPDEQLGSHVDIQP